MSDDDAAGVEPLHGDTEFARAVRGMIDRSARIKRALRTLTRWVPLVDLAERCGMSEAELLQRAADGEVELATLAPDGERLFLTARACRALVLSEEGRLRATQAQPLYQTPWRWAHRTGAPSPTLAIGDWWLSARGLCAMEGEANEFQTGQNRGGARMSHDTEELPEARTPAELLRLVLEVGKRLAGMTGDWWSRERFRPGPRDSDTFVVIDPEGEAAAHRRRTAAQDRDALRLQALRLCGDDPALPAPPPPTRDAEKDITDALAQWCIDAQRIGAMEKSMNEEVSANTTSVNGHHATTNQHISDPEQALNFFIGHLRSSDTPPDCLRLTANALKQWGMAFRRKKSVGWSVFGVYPKEILCRTNEIACWLQEIHGQPLVEQRFLQPINAMQEVFSEAYDNLFAPGRSNLSSAEVWKHTAAAGRAAIECAHKLQALYIELTSAPEVSGLAGGTSNVGRELDRHAPYMPADWFRDKFGIPASRLRAALRTERLVAINVGTKRPRYQYSVPDAMRLWPDDGIYLPDASG